MTQTFLKFFQPEVSKKKLLAVSFKVFWKLYPKKVGKGYAKKCYIKINSKVNLALIMLEALKKQLKSEEWKDKKYIPNPSTWLNQGRWDDELTYKETMAEKHERLKAKGEL